MRMNCSIPSLSVPTRLLRRHEQVPLTSKGRPAGCPFACAAVFVRVPKSRIMRSLPIQNRGICGKEPGSGTFPHVRVGEVSARQQCGRHPRNPSRYSTPGRIPSREWFLWEERPFRFRSRSLPVPHNETERATRCPMSPILVRMRKIVGELDRLVPSPGECWQLPKGCFVWNRTERPQSFSYTVDNIRRCPPTPLR
jgi:hypothetical protein